MTKVTIETNFGQFASAISSFNGAREIQSIVNAMAKLEVLDLQRYPARMAATPGTSGLHSNGNFAKAGRYYYTRGSGMFYRRKRGGDTRVSTSENLKGSWHISSAPALTVISNSASYAGYVHGAETSSPKQSSVMARRNWKSTDTTMNNLAREITSRLPNDLGNLFRRFMGSKGFEITAG